MRSSFRKITILLFVLLFAVSSYGSNARLFTSAQMSSSLVKKLCQDKYGFIWEGTEYGLNRFDGYRFVTYYYNRNDTTSIPGNEVASMLAGKDGSLWIGFSNGLARYDYATNSFVRYHFPDGVLPRVSSMTFDNNGDLLAGTAGFGLFRVRKGSKVVEKDTYYNMCTDGTYSLLYIDVRGQLWRYSGQSGLANIKPRKKGSNVVTKNISLPSTARAFFPFGKQGFLVATSKSILRYDFRTAKLSEINYDFSEMGEGTLVQGAAMCHNGDILLGTSGRGLWRIKNALSPANSVVEPVEATINSFSLALSSINEALEDRSGNLWVNCYRKGLALLSEESSAFQLWSLADNNVITGSSISGIAAYEGGVLGILPGKGLFRFRDDGTYMGFMDAPSGIRVVYRDRHGEVWLASGGTLFSYDVNRQSANRELTLPSGVGIKQITDNGHGLYFFSSPGNGLAIYDRKTGKTSIISMKDKRGKLGDLCNDWINDMYADGNHRLWLCTSDGFTCMDTRTTSFVSQGWRVQLEGVNCQTVVPFSKGKLLIGTPSDLNIYDIASKKLEVFPRSGLLADKSIRCIVPDGSGDFWVSTMNGIWQYDHNTGNFIGHISGNGLATREYLSLQAFHDGNGLIGFGTPYGITVFRPIDVSKNAVSNGTVHLTDVVIGGKERGCTLDHYYVANDEKAISMSFSLLDFRNTDNIVFQYRINGGEWTLTDNYSNTVSFNNVSYGDYVLEVRALSNGQPLKGVKTIKISVAAPWYLSTLAFIVYALALIAIGITLFIYYNRRKNRELEEAKMRFLINATHDIRSPLTLIMGPLKKLKERITDSESQKDLDIIDRNARRLQTLVNQILDKRKIDKQQLRLHCRETDLVGYVGDIVSLYQFNAKERGIKLVFNHPREKVKAWIDRSQFDKVIANLLSNAFKYTPDGGEIDVSLESKEDRAMSKENSLSNRSSVVLTVSDTGSGISAANVNKIFERFYQGDNSRALHVGGTGIGLNLCRALVLMHGGTIKAGNRTDGRTGAVFTVELPLGNQHLKPEQIEQEPVAEKNSKRTQANRNIRVMVVDDDAEVARYIKQELSDWYRIETFGNGKDALRSLLIKPYDIVVSDVVMPEMDGITLLKNIKGNTKISDIPVILLTSQSEVADRLEGLRRGADAYIAKPFNMDELHVTIDNLVDNVRRLRGKFSGAQQQADKIDDIEVKGNDDELMKRITESVNKNLSDPDFNVEKLCDDIAVSRTQLHRKMKELTGISTGDFIRNIRLEQAAKLIKEGKINVTQVAYAVGFNNPSHFATVFKKHFGMTPTEYAAANADE